MMHTINRLIMLLLAILMAVALAGCQSDASETQRQIDELRSQLDEANSRIEELKQERDTEAGARSSPGADDENSRDDVSESDVPESPALESSSDETATAGGTKVIDLSSSGQKSLTSSSSFTAGAGQTLTLEVKASIQGGTVDLFLFSPSNQEQKFTFAGDDNRTIELTAGTWAYNCTGFFESGEITITGTLG